VKSKSSRKKKNLKKLIYLREGHEEEIHRNGIQQLGRMRFKNQKGYYFRRENSALSTAGCKDRGSEQIVVDQVSRKWRQTFASE